LEIGCRAQAFAVGFLVESLAGFSPVGSGLAEFPSIQERHKIRTLKAEAFGRPVFLPEGENIGRDAIGTFAPKSVNLIFKSGAPDGLIRPRIRQQKRRK